MGVPGAAHLRLLGSGLPGDRLCKASEQNKLTVPQGRGACLLTSGE